MLTHPRFVCREAPGLHLHAMETAFDQQRVPVSTRARFGRRFGLLVDRNDPPRAPEVNRATPERQAPLIQASLERRRLHDARGPPARGVMLSLGTGGGWNSRPTTISC